VTLWPSTLFGRVAGILFVGLVVAHGLTFAWILRERVDLGASMMSGYLGRDIASSVAILDRVPPAERPDWLPRLARENYYYALAELPGSPIAPAGNRVGAVLPAIVQAIGAARVEGLRATPERDAVALQLRLADGAPLAVEFDVPRWMPSWTTIAVLCAQLGALALVTWLAVRLATRPMTDLADAANRLESDLRAPPLPESGPLEVTRAASAFNAMRARIAAALDERLRILASISHDLRTPITRMNLRAELVADPETRERLQADLAEMQALVEEGIAYARTAHATVEPEQPVDLHALLDGIVADYQDAGRAVHWSGRRDAPLRTRPHALRRIVTNLVNNALAFAGEAEIAVDSTQSAVEIAVRDRGPGIARDRLEAVLQPFVRLDDSRSRATGGAGLGLAIASELATVLRGRLALRNRDGGGLEARLILPP
jgi:signal transduction histidine kinase